jgi:alkylation response protein AidB-like acyl-CoA dehydrogenase
VTRPEKKSRLSRRARVIGAAVLGVVVLGGGAGFYMKMRMDAAEALAIAKFWAADGAHRVTHAAQHLHGGIGVDLDYPLHRYFLWGKQLEHELGTPTRQLLTLGASLAANPV